MCKLRHKLRAIPRIFLLAASNLQNSGSGRYFHRGGRVTSFNMSRPGSDGDCEGDRDVYGDGNGDQNLVVVCAGDVEVVIDGDLVLLQMLPPAPARL